MNDGQQQPRMMFERGSDGGFGAWSPDVPGVVAAAGTLAECEALMRDAIEFHLEGLAEDEAYARNERYDQLDAMAVEAARFGLYESTATPTETR